MQIVVVVYRWLNGMLHSTPQLFHFKSLGLLAVSQDNSNAGVVWC